MSQIVPPGMMLRVCKTILRYALPCLSSHPPSSCAHPLPGSMADTDCSDGSCAIRPPPGVTGSSAQPSSSGGGKAPVLVYSRTVCGLCWMCRFARFGLFFSWSFSSSLYPCFPLCRGRGRCRCLCLYLTLSPPSLGSLRLTLSLPSVPWRDCTHELRGRPRNPPKADCSRFAGGISGWLGWTLSFGMLTKTLRNAPHPTPLIPSRCLIASFFPLIFRTIYRLRLLS